MSTYGITATNLVDSHAAAMARNLYSAGTELIDQRFPSISNYYYDIAIEYAGGGLLTMTRVWMASPPTEAAQIHIGDDGSAPSGTLGNSFDLTPTQYATQAPYTAIGIKRATVRQIIQDGQVVWAVDGYQTEAYITNSQTGFYDNSRDDAELTIVQSTVPVTFDDDIPWIFQTWLDTPLLTYSPPQSFLDGLTKESNYYITYYMGRINGDTTASNAQRIYFRQDPGTIHVRTCPTGSNTGWYISWDNPDETDQAWNYNLSNANGTSSDWSYTGGSAGWAHDMYEYDSSRDPHNGYRVLQPYWLFIIESTVPIDYAGNEIEPSPGPGVEKANYLFYKDNFVMRYGLRTLPSSDYWDGISQTSPTGRANDVNCYYYTPKVDPVIRFTSRVDDRDYSVKVIDLDRNDAGFPVCEPNFKVTNLNASPPEFELFYNINFGKPYIAEYRALQGSYNQQEITDATYNEMTELDHVDLGVSLGELVEHFRKLNPDFGSNDIFTTIYMDFVEYDTDNILATKELDFSSLYNSGIDVTTDDGSGDGEGHSWDPLPGHENDDTNPTYNPPATNRVDMNKPELTPYGLFNRTYILNSIAVTQLGDILSTTDDDKFDAILDGLKMFGAKPMDALIDLRLYPFDVQSQTDSGGSIGEQIILGRYNTEILGIIMRGNNCIIPLGSMFIKPKYNSFLDYEPYTTIRIYIPYIGTIELSPSIYMNRTVHVQLVVDFTTGAGTAVIYCNGIPMTYHSGVIGVSIPMTGDDASAYSNGIIGNLVGAVGSAAGAVVSAVTGNIGGAVKQGASALGDLFDMGQSFNDVKFQQAGSASPSAANWLPQKCHIMIARPKLNFKTKSDMELFGETVGFATAYSCRIMDLANNGIYYGVLAEHLGAGGATEPIPTVKEVDMMKQTLNNGFFVQ